MNFTHCSRRTWMNSASYSCSVYHAPPVISRLGSSSYSMYTFLFCCATCLTALMSLRASSDLKIFPICVCGRLDFCFSSLVQMPVFPLCWMIWYTSRSSLLRPLNFTASSCFTSLYTRDSPSLKICSLRCDKRRLIATARSVTGMCEIFAARSPSGMPSGCNLHCSRMAVSAIALGGVPRVSVSYRLSLRSTHYAMPASVTGGLSESGPRLDHREGDAGASTSRAPHVGRASTPRNVPPRDSGDGRRDARGRLPPPPRWGSRMRAPHTSRRSELGAGRWDRLACW
mmetsp:Transcript_216/g.861  ORF Transcript_216/g.861 Transcript_216/m.861 type:complete len:285 (-) Transcript_216:23-877(-)